MEWISHVVAVLRNPKLAAVLLVATILCMYVPAGIHPGFAQFRSQHGHWLVVALCLLAAVLIVELAALILHQRRARREREARERRVVELLAELDSDEQILLREFFIQDRNTIKLPIELPVVLGLLRAGILVVVARLPQACSAGFVGAVRLSDAARPHLSPEVLGLPASLGDDDVQRMRRERPFYMREIREYEQTWES